MVETEPASPSMSLGKNAGSTTDVFTRLTSAPVRKVNVFRHGGPYDNPVTITVPSSYSQLVELCNERMNLKQPLQTIFLENGKVVSDVRTIPDRASLLVGFGEPFRPPPSGLMAFGYSRKNLTKKKSTGRIRHFSLDSKPPVGEKVSADDDPDSESSNQRTTLRTASLMDRLRSMETALRTRDAKIASALDVSTELSEKQRVRLVLPENDTDHIRLRSLSTDAGLASIARGSSADLSSTVDSSKMKASPIPDPISLPVTPTSPSMPSRASSGGGSLASVESPAFAVSYDAAGAVLSHPPVPRTSLKPPISPKVPNTSTVVTSELTKPPPSEKSLGVKSQRTDSRGGTSQSVENTPFTNNVVANDQRLSHRRQLSSSSVSSSSSGSSIGLTGATFQNKVSHPKIPKSTDPEVTAHNRKLTHSISLQPSPTSVSHLTSRSPALGDVVVPKPTSTSLPASPSTPIHGQLPLALLSHLHSQMSPSHRASPTPTLLEASRGALAAQSSADDLLASPSAGSRPIPSSPRSLLKAHSSGSRRVRWEDEVDDGPRPSTMARSFSPCHTPGGTLLELTEWGAEHSEAEIHAHSPSSHGPRGMSFAPAKHNALGLGPRRHSIPEGRLRDPSETMSNPGARVHPATEAQAGVAQSEGNASVIADHPGPSPEILSYELLRTKKECARISRELLDSKQREKERSKYFAELETTIATLRTQVAGTSDRRFGSDGGRVEGGFEASSGLQVEKQLLDKLLQKNSEVDGLRNQLRATGSQYDALQAQFFSLHQKYQTLKAQGEVAPENDLYTEIRPPPPTQLLRAKVRRLSEEFEGFNLNGISSEVSSDGRGVTSDEHTSSCRPAGTSDSSLAEYKREIRRLSGELADRGATVLSLRKELLDRDSRILQLEEAQKGFGPPAKQLIKALDGAVRSLRAELRVLKREVRDGIAGLIPELSVLGNRLVSKSIEGNLSITRALEQAQQKYHRELDERRRLYNVVQEIRGNIRVFCRVRPLLAIELKEGEESVVSITDSQGMRDGTSYEGTTEGIACVEIFSERSNAVKSFEFDRVFGPASTQSEVFLEVEQVVLSVLDGYNACIFAYGQTGSGKTYTMEGPADDVGVNFRAMARLFQLVGERADAMDYLITVSMIEIYNELIRDLLDDGETNALYTSQKKKLEVHHGADGMFVSGVTQTRVESVEQTMTVVSHGMRNRTIGQTKMNELSSRSHSLLQIKVRGVSKTTGIKYFGKLNLVDLAGSERVSKTEAEGIRLKEAQHINRSLSALGDVVAALIQKSKHIPYRNSKLTHVLQDSLGGNSKTIMFVQISPVAAHAGESTSSLLFGARVRTVEVGPAKQNVDDAEVKRLKSLLQISEEEAEKEKEKAERLQQELVSSKQSIEETEEFAKLRQHISNKEKESEELRGMVADLEERLAAATRQLQQHNEQLARSDPAASDAITPRFSSVFGSSMSHVPKSLSDSRTQELERVAMQIETNKNKEIMTIKGKHSEEVRAINSKIRVLERTDAMKRGSIFGKLCYNRRKQGSAVVTQRYVSLSPDEQYLTWGELKKRSKKKVAITDIINLTYGMVSDNFRAHGRLLQHHEPFVCFSIWVPQRTLDLLAPDLATLKDWVMGLQSLVLRCGCVLSNPLTEGGLLWERARMRVRMMARRKQLSTRAYLRRVFSEAVAASDPRIREKLRRERNSSVEETPMALSSAI
eukprot:Rmarinus@m.14713